MGNGLLHICGRLKEKPGLGRAGCQQCNSTSEGARPSTRNDWVMTWHGCVKKLDLPATYLTLVDRYVVRFYWDVLAFT